MHNFTVYLFFLLYNSYISTVSPSSESLHLNLIKTYSNTYDPPHLHYNEKIFKAN